MIPDVFLRRSQHRYHLRHCTMLDEWKRGGSGPDGFIVSSSAASFGFLSAQNCHKLSELYIYIIIEGSLEVKLPTIRTDEKQRWEESAKRRRKKIKKEKVSEERRSRCAKGRKDCVFPMICGSGGSKSRLAKAAGAEPAGQMRDEQLHAVVARSTCRSQNVQSKSGPDHYWKLRCRKSARRSGAKHISKSKV